jgi:hypothetical protein
LESPQLLSQLEKIGFDCTKVKLEGRIFSQRTGIRNRGKRSEIEGVRELRGMLKGTRSGADLMGKILAEISGRIAENG